MKYQSKDLRQFPAQIRYAIDNFTSPSFKVSDFDNIILCGLGGSGIAGRIIKSCYFDKCSIPVEVISDYVIPHYAGKRTLAIMCSYSGNTEETLAMYDVAKAKGTGILVIATGGKLAELAKKDGYPFLQALSGFQPRMALGYSLTYLFLLFSEMFSGKSAAAELKAATEALDNESKYMDAASKLFKLMEKKLPAKIIVITDYFSSPIGLRFCQQIQENAKAEAFLHELPESNHNVIESYYGRLDSIFLFLNSQAHPRTVLRFNFLKGVLEKEGNEIIEMPVDSNGILPLLETIYTLDWLSLIIAEHKGVNSIDIRNINALKQHLSAN
jgi:glucose/mannose-6-phosphate isomerase